MWISLALAIAAGLARTVTDVPIGGMCNTTDQCTQPADCLPDQAKDGDRFCYQKCYNSEHVCASKLGRNSDYWCNYQLGTEPTCQTQRDDCKDSGDMNHPPCGLLELHQATADVPASSMLELGQAAQGGYYADPPTYGVVGPPRPPLGNACIIRRVSQTSNCSEFHNDKKLCLSWYICERISSGWSVIKCQFTAKTANLVRPGEGTCGNATTPLTQAEVGNCCAADGIAQYQGDTDTPGVDPNSLNMANFAGGSMGMQNGIGAYLELRTRGRRAPGFLRPRRHGATQRHAPQHGRRRAQPPAQRAWRALRARVLHRRARMLREAVAELHLRGGGPEQHGA